MGNRKNECSLCGGKLRNGICMECGMDNRKCDDMYTGVLNRGQYQTRNLRQKEPQAQGQRRKDKKFYDPKPLRRETAVKAAGLPAFRNAYSSRTVCFCRALCVTKE